MMKITEEQYKLALDRVEELLPQVDDSTPLSDTKAVELKMMSDIVIEYEKEHFPIEKPTVAQLIAAGLQEQKLTQKELALELGVSTTRVNDFVSGKSEPNLRIAGRICQILKIRPAAMLML
ncbi:MAG: helix-turn-helix domain-containing protein [Bacteroidaceae bacterium]|nr:helix-turn-helix domain-containing protein [Candidatus Minthousia equi]MCQ2246640.1 helix-turn-helix domain-containing protein [Bacteroidaceae bacterium]